MFIVDRNKILPQCLIRFPSSLFMITSFGHPRIEELMKWTRYLAFFLDVAKYFRYICNWRLCWPFCSIAMIIRHVIHNNFCSMNREIVVHKNVVIFWIMPYNYSLLSLICKYSTIIERSPVFV